MEDFVVHVLRTQDTATATFGELYVNRELIAMTLELPWRENQNFISSIPEGKYSALLRYDKERDESFTIELQGTEDRPGIQVHVGNSPIDTQGCILIGLAARIADERLQRSKEAIQRLKALFYGTSMPVSSPDVAIKVIIDRTATQLRFYPSRDSQFFWTYENEYWVPSDTSDGATRYKEFLRDSKWIISKSEEGGAFQDRYVRWATLGNSPFQVSKDLKSWTTLAAEENIRREPMPRFELWNAYAHAGFTLVDMLRTQGKRWAFRNFEGDAPGDEDGRENGEIYFNFDNPEAEDYQGGEEDKILVDLDRGDQEDDYSSYQDASYDGEESGGETGNDDSAEADEADQPSADQQEGTLYDDYDDDDGNPKYG